MRNAVFDSIKVWVFVCFAWLGICGYTMGQSTDTSQTVDWSEKKFVVEKRKEKWLHVFEWLSNQSGLHFISTEVIPLGTLTLISPKGRRYSLREIFDIINEALQQQRFVLIRSEHSFSVLPADQRLDPNLIPQVSIKDLNKRGRMEIVSVILPLKTLTALRLQTEIQKMMGPFGEVIALDEANQLLLRDTVKTLKRIIAAVGELEKGYLKQSQTYTHKCNHIRASLAAEKVKEFLGDEKEQINVVDGNGKLLKIVRTYHVTSSDETNTVHVNGPPEKIARAKLLLERLDVKVERKASAFLKTYMLPDGNAEGVTKALQAIFENKSDLRVEAISTSSIMVYGQVDDHFDIAKYLEALKGPQLKTKMIPLAGGIDSVKMAETLNAMFYGATASAAPYIDADITKNAIIVRGTQNQVADVEQTVQAIAGTKPSNSPGTRIITLPNGRATTMARVLEQLLRQMTDNPVRIVGPASRQRMAR